MDNIMHVVPIDDLEEHIIDFKKDCKCNPNTVITDDGYIIVIHNSYDGREYVERLRNSNIN